MRVAKYCYGVLSVLLFIFIGIGSSYSMSGYYSIQIAAVVKKSSEMNIIQTAKKIHTLYPATRVERDGGYYVLRIGLFKTRMEAERKLPAIRARFPDAFIKRCSYRPLAWIYPAPHRKSGKKPDPSVSRPASERLCPSSVCPKVTKSKKVAVNIGKPEEELKKASMAVEGQSKETVKEKRIEKEEQNTESSPSTKKFFLEKYVFVDGYAVKGLDPKDMCRRNGSEITGRAGLRFAWQITNGISLWGDLFGGIGYQSFMHSNRKRGWFDVRYLYLSTKSVYEPDYHGYYGSLGRIPVIDKRGFWFYNYLDGIKGGYRSTLLNWFVFLGKRFEDSRFSNSEERINIQGYDYIVAHADYQYYYRHHLGGFYLFEHKSKFSNLDGASVWKGVRNRESLNWLGIRLNGTFSARTSDVDYWFDLGYMWGKRGFATAAFKGCTAYKSVISTSYKSMKGFGVELGGKTVIGKTGLGARVAVGEGSDTVSHNRGFYLPKLSILRDKMFGFNRIRYYGELANPDLNNLLIISLFGGYNIYPDNWIEINLLKYLQYSKTGGVPFGRYFLAPNGSSRDIGYEMDLMLDGRIKTADAKWRYLLTGSLFIPGRAFNGMLDEKDAYGVFLKVKRYW